MMKTRLRLLASFKGILAVLLVGFLTQGCMPIVIPVDIPLGGTQFGDLGGLGGILAGQPLPDDLEFGNLLCDVLPSDFDAFIEEAAGELVAGLVHLESVELIKTVMTATEGNFNDFTKIGFFYQAGGQRIDLGTAESGSGLGTVVELAPPAPVDLLDVVASCESMGIAVSGVVPAPENTPSWETVISVVITARIGF